MMIFQSAALAVLLFSLDVLAVTCPGFPGYCSESFPGQTCVVVCSRGRNNVPLCQADGTWTDIPRCIEHDPGVPTQVTGVCPGISGYCSESFIGQRCNFACSIGPQINSLCSQDGTWIPYPTCIGDLRETQDGCVACPGPNGRPRNRTAEAVLGIVSHNPVPVNKVTQGVDAQGRVVRPTFSGNQAFGAVASPQQPQPVQRQPAPVPQAPVFREQTSQAPVFREQTSQAPVFREPQPQPPVFREQPQPQPQPPVFREQPQQAFAPQVAPHGVRQPTGFSPEQQSIIQKFSAQVEGFPRGQIQEPRQLPPPNFQSLGTPAPRGPRPDPVFPRPDQDSFGPFEVVQPPEENAVDIGPLTAFPAIPVGSPQELQKARERPSAFGPFQLVDL